MLAHQTGRIIRFSSFEVDLQTGELRRSGIRIRLQEQPFQVLVMLLERPGELVTREQLQHKLWSSDTFVDFDHSLNAAIKRLREALGESAETPVFVETLARRGYRFIAPVDGLSVPRRVALSAAGTHKSLSYWSAGIFASAVVLAFLAWAPWRHSSRPTEVIERSLTANSSENSVSSAAVSPDGKYFAYGDNTGIYLKLVRTGETHPVPLPPNFSAAVDDWFPDGSHLLVSRLEQPGTTSLWSISIFGGSPRKLAENASGGSLSPDGTHIAFRRGEPSYESWWRDEEWVMRSDGADQVKVAAFKAGSVVGMPTWSLDGKRIAYVRLYWAFNARAASVEVNEWQNATTETLFPDSRLGPALHWLPDGRLLYTLESPQNRDDPSLWVVPLQPSAKISSPPTRLVGKHGWISNITASADGKVVIFLRGNWMPSVYLGTLAADARHLLAHRRLTLDENENVPFAWTPDSKAVLFSSDRNGTREIFKQAIDQPLPESVVSSAEQLSLPRLTPDGSELLYVSTPKSAGPKTLSSIFAVPIGGGTPRFILKDVGINNVQCARLPSTICLYSITNGNTLETYRFDLSHGKSSDPPQVDKWCDWTLSPDGSQRAVIVKGTDEDQIHLRSTSTGQGRDLVIKGWRGLEGLDWSSDGRSIFVPWHNHESASALLRVTLDGRASVLLRSSNPEFWDAIPSPDGRFLAIGEASGTRNVWQVENF